MGNRQNPRILSNMDATLLKHSIITKSYSWLEKIISESPKCRWNEIDTFLDGIKVDEHLVSSIIATAVKEWECKSHSDRILALQGRYLTCELCGYNRCLALYPIFNLNNNITLNIGSTCVTHYNVKGADRIKEWILCSIAHTVSLRGSFAHIATLVMKHVRRSPNGCYAFCNSSNELVLTVDNTCLLLDIKKLGSGKYLPLFLFPDSFRITLFDNYIRNPERRFSSVSEGMEYINEMRKVGIDFTML